MRFQMETTEGRLTYPDDFQKDWWLLFYYSGDFTPVAATELIELAKMQGDFARAGCRLLCISEDRIPSHLAFIAALDRYRAEPPIAPIRFPLGQDAQGALARALKLESCKKYLWLLGPTGQIRAHFSYPAEIGANFTEPLRALLALQTERSTPCGWVPDGPTLALPPASREEARSYIRAQEQQGGRCIDWYLCFE